MEIVKSELRLLALQPVGVERGRVQFCQHALATVRIDRRTDSVRAVVYLFEGVSKNFDRSLLRGFPSNILAHNNYAFDCQFGTK